MNKFKLMPLHIERFVFMLGTMRVMDVCEESITSYSLSRYIGCTPKTALKWLNYLEINGYADSRIAYHRGNIEKKIFHVSEMGDRLFNEKTKMYSSTIAKLVESGCSDVW